MDGNTTLILVNIAIIGIISIIIVKIYFKEENRTKLESEKESNISNNNYLKRIISSGKNIISKNKNRNETQARRKNNAYNNVSNYFQNQSLSKDGKIPENDDYIIPEQKEVPQFKEDIASENTNKESVMFQEPIEDKHWDIMNQNKEEQLESNDQIKKEDEIKEQRKSNNNEEELKDLFTIDELIEESKRKDAEREKSIKEIENTIKTKTDKQEPFKDTDEAKSKISETNKPGDEENITNILKASNQNIETPNLESQTKFNEEIEKTELDNGTTIDKEEDKKEKQYSDDGVSLLPTDEDENEFGKPIEESTLFNYDDLDYRKDLAKISNTIKNSRIIKDVRNKLQPNEEETLEHDYIRDHEYIRNVSSYETLEDEEEDKLRQKNTRKVFEMAKNSSQVPKKFKPTPKAVPEQNSIVIPIGNTKVTLKKGDEIIFKHSGETYSSQVFKINGDNIQVRYRRQNIIIHPSDVKKIL